MRVGRSGWVLLGVVALAAGSLWADKWPLPKARVFAAWTGNYAIKIVPPAAPGRETHAKGTLFSLAEDGSEHTVWEKELVNIPMSAIVEPGGKYVVTIDTYANLGYEHALVIYDAKGAVVADHKLEDLLSKQDIEKHVAQSISSRHWMSGWDATKIRLDGDAPFEIVFAWGRTLVIDPKTGKVTTKANAMQPAKP